MNPRRRKQVIEYCKDLQGKFPNMSIKDCFFALYEYRMITAKELDYLIDWMYLYS